MHQMNELRGRMDLLLALDALLTTASVTRAAERANLSQPAMSRALGRLREAFDDALLVRAAGATRLTPRAEALREPVAEILRRTAMLLAPVRFDPASASQLFRCVIPDVLAATIVPCLLGILRTEAPGCQLALEPWPGRPGAPPDAVVTSEPSPFQGYAREPLFQDRDMLVGSINCAPDAALSMPHVAVVPAGFTGDPVDAWLATLGLTRRIGASVPTYLLALRLVAATDLLAILPSRLIASVGEPMGLKAAALAVEQQPDQIWLLYPPHVKNDGGGVWLRGAIARAAASPD